MKRFNTKKVMREAIEQLRVADDMIESIRRHFDPTADNEDKTQLDRAMSTAQEHLVEAREEISDVLLKFSGKSVTVSFPKVRS